MFEQVTQVDLDRAASELRGSQKSDKAVHITSDVEIVVYGVFAERASSDAYLALPTDVLGMEYYVPCTTIVRNWNEEGLVDIPSGRISFQFTSVSDDPMFRCMLSAQKRYVFLQSIVQLNFKQIYEGK